MSVDPSDPETFDRNDSVEGVDIDVEAPEADAAEQHTDITPREEEFTTGADPGLDADEADRAEQARVVELNEDEYR